MIWLHDDDDNDDDDNHDDDNDDDDNDDDDNDDRGHNDDYDKGDSPGERMHRFFGGNFDQL